MPEVDPGYFKGSDEFRRYFDHAHAAGALDEKTKELMHLAVVLAVNCEP